MDTPETPPPLFSEHIFNPQLQHICIFLPLKNRRLQTVDKFCSLGVSPIQRFYKANEPN